MKWMCDIFKDCRKAFDEKCNENKSQIETKTKSGWVIVKIVHKDKNGVCYDENIMGSEVEEISCSKDEWKKRVLSGALLW